MAAFNGDRDRAKNQTLRNLTMSSRGGRPTTSNNNTKSPISQVRLEPFEACATDRCFNNSILAETDTR